MRWGPVLGWALAGALLGGCDQEDSSGQVDPDTPDFGAVVADGSVRPDMAPAPDMAQPDAEAADADVEPDAMNMGDAELPDMAAAPDAQAPVEIDDCQAACGRFADCDRLAQDWGSEEACLIACERSSRAEIPTEWFECLGEESCGTLRFCPLPDPPPLTCAEVCSAAEVCDVPNPFGNCEAACEGLEGAAQEAFSVCGEALIGACREEMFWGCLGEDVYPACAPRCQAAVECGVLERASCVPDCIGELSAADPLARLRGEQRSACVRLAGDDCDGVTACLSPELEPDPGAVDCNTFCERVDSCGAIFGDCLLECDQLITEDPVFFQPILECVVAELPANGQCDLNVLQRCFEGGGGGGGVAAGCQGLCEAQGVCALLPEAEMGPLCNQACVDDIAAGGQRALAREAALACRGAETCDELSDCLGATTPEAICAAWCGSLDGCGLPPGAGDAAACVEACVANFAPERQQAWRGCVAEAGEDCEAMAACAPPTAPPCDLFCARAGACGVLLDGEECRLECDDNHYLDPEQTVERVACALSAPECQPVLGGGFSVQACLQGENGREPPPPMTDCYQYCRAVTECAPGAERALGACLSECGAGLPEGDALRLRAGDCLRNLPATASCDALTDCVDGLEPATSCPAYCEAAEGCGLEEACAERCPEVLTAERDACVAEAARLQRGCGVMAACVGFDGLQPTEECVALCSAQLTCDPGLDQFLCQRQCTPPPEGIEVQLACLEVSGCGGVDTCLALGPEIPAVCAQVCENTAPCAGPWGAEGDCLVDCAGLVGSPSTSGELAAGLPACVQAAVPEGVCDAQAVAECFAPAPQCDEVCAIVDQCGLFPPGFCQDILCPEGELAPNDPVALCAVEQAEAGRCDFNSFIQCLEGGP